MNITPEQSPESYNGVTSRRLPVSPVKSKGLLEPSDIIFKAEDMFIFPPRMIVSLRVGFIYPNIDFNNDNTY
jgi:hypothetical protein